MIIDAADIFVKMVVVENWDQDSEKMLFRWWPCKQKIFCSIENSNDRKCKQ